MNYISTRNNIEPVSAAEAIARGMVPNGGLFVPEAIPALDAAERANRAAGNVENISEAVESANAAAQRATDAAAASVTEPAEEEIVFEDIQLQDVNGNKETGIKTFT